MKKKVQHPVGIEPTTSQVSVLEACALLLGYNRCPKFKIYLVTENLFAHGEVLIL